MARSVGRAAARRSKDLDKLDFGDSLADISMMKRDAPSAKAKKDWTKFHAELAKARSGVLQKQRAVEKVRRAKKINSLVNKYSREELKARNYTLTLPQAKIVASGREARDLLNANRRRVMSDYLSR